jgi:hypothetical protein
MAVDALAVYTVGMEQTKTCTTCSETKPLDAFRLNAMGKLGRYSKCRSCEAVVRKANEGSESRKAAYKKYRNTDAGRTAQKAAAERYRQSDKGRETDRSYYRSRHWYMLCKASVNNAVQAGALLPASSTPCVVGADCEGPHQWHHDSYLKEDWLNVRCLCAKHHREWHRNNKPRPFEEGGSM